MLYIHCRKWKEADKCKRLRMLTNSIKRTLCVANIAPTITPDGNTVNRTAFDELYSDSDFDDKQKAKQYFQLHCGLSKGTLLQAGNTQLMLGFPFLSLSEV